MSHNRMRVLIVAGAAIALLLSGCAAATPSEAPSATVAGAQLEVTAAWMKAAPIGQDTAVFAELTSRSGHAATIVAASSPSAASAQLHTTTMAADGSMNMQEASNLTVPASAPLTLQPGGDHIMLRGLTRQFEPGDTVEVTLRLSDGSRTSFRALVKNYAGAQETYPAAPSPTSSR